MQSVARLGSLVFETPSISAMHDFYRDVLGLHTLTRTARQTILADRCGREVLILREGDRAACSTVTFALANGDDMRAVARQLKDLGLRVEAASDVTDAMRECMSFVDSKGTEVLLFVDRPAQIPAQDVNGIAPLKLGHVAFASADVRKIVDLYVNGLGFRESDWVEDIFAFLRCGPDHHTVNFLHGEQTHMHHVAYELKDWAHVQQACDLLGKRKVPIIWGPGRHRVGHNVFVYHRDPDDHVIELYTELDQMKSEALGFFEPRPWHEYAPQTPRVWTRDEGLPLWGPAPSADFRRGGQAHLAAEA
jgi:catechol 2,3-dioxygenase-like lactoylglutathione lyase family enzyme